MRNPPKKSSGFWLSFTTPGRGHPLFVTKARMSRILPKHAWDWYIDLHWSLKPPQLIGKYAIDGVFGWVILVLRSRTMQVDVPCEGPHLPFSTWYHVIKLLIRQATSFRHSSSPSQTRRHSMGLPGWTANPLTPQTTTPIDRQSYGSPMERLDI